MDVGKCMWVGNVDRWLLTAMPDVGARAKAREVGAGGGGGYCWATTPTAASSPHCRGSEYQERPHPVAAVGAVTTSAGVAVG